ncbi:MAG: MerR family transcriptional regulator [Chitinophagaceae bacterium]|nr:MerR family transcriptional regulator [Chitinophagaceae bacterium]
MANYHIKQFEALSGVKAHTIRIWEQRYGLLKPTRSDTNIRQYNDDELTLLLNISLLNRNGFKISQVAKMKQAEIEDKVRSITSTNFEFPNQVDALTLAMVELDESEFERVISINIAHLGFEAAMEQIVFPFLRNIGILWQTGSVNPAQEHFISNLIRQKLIVAIDRLEVVRSSAVSKTLLYLPEGELHELGLLYLNYLLRKKQHHIMYLGQNVPLRDVEKVSSVFKPNQVYSIFTSFPAPVELSGYVSKLAKLFPKCKIFLSGYIICTNTIKAPRNVQLINAISDLKGIIDNQ